MTNPLALGLAAVALACLAAAASAAPASAVLEGLSGQACTGHTQTTALFYALREQGGKWSVRYGKSANGPWRDASADGAILTFNGAFANQVELTATGPHSAQASFKIGIHAYGPYELACQADTAR